MGKSAVKERRPEAAPASVDTGACRHHWIIESPRGALSDGRCKICGEERQVRNSASDYIWDDDSSSGYGRWGWRAPIPVARKSRSPCSSERRNPEGVHCGPLHFALSLPSPSAYNRTGVNL